MKKFKHLIIVALGVSLLSASCSKDDSSTSSEESGNWIAFASPVDPFAGSGRTEAVTFTIGTDIYVGSGYNSSSNTRYLNFYKFSGGAWSRIADMPNPSSTNPSTDARSSAVAFSAGTAATGGVRGYVGLGISNGGLTKHADFYEYNPTTNAWTKVANDFLGGKRYNAVAFTIDGIGYVGSGYGEDLLGDGEEDARNSFYKFTPGATAGSGTWASAGAAGQKRSGAVAFVSGGKGYLVTGTNNGLVTNCPDMLEYTPATTGEGTWTAKRKITVSNSSESYDDDYTDIARSEAVVFVVDGYAYLTTGNINGSYTSKTWMYNIATDVWTRKTAFEKSTRDGAISFVYSGFGYVGTGASTGSPYSDFQKFDPAGTYTTND